MESPRALNLQLRRIHQLLAKNPALKGQLDFTVHRKAGPSESEPAKPYKDWRQVRRFTGLDFDTICLLEAPERRLWVQQPEHFVSIHHVPTSSFSHPILQLTWQYLVLQQLDAKATILRRCLLVALWEVKRQFDVPATVIAQHLAPYLPIAAKRYQNKTGEELLAMLVLEVDHMFDAGSRYKQIDTDAGPGAIVVLGKTLGPDLCDMTQRDIG